MMKIILGILLGIVSLVIVWFMVPFFAIFFVGLENSRDADAAVAQMARVTSQEKMLIRDSCAQAMQSTESMFTRTLRDGEIPAELAFLDPEFLYVSADNCRVFLNKGLGVGIGYSLKHTHDGRQIFSWFNEYHSWDHHVIEERAVSP